MMNFKKILVIKLRSLGDTVLSVAAIQELRNAFPDAQIHAVVYSPWDQLLSSHPAINRLVAVERHRERTARYKTLARVGLALRKEGYDCAVVFHASPSTATLAFAVGAPTRAIHFHGHKDKNRHATVEIPGKGVVKPITERDMDTVRALGLKIPEGRMPALYLSQHEIATWRERLDRQHFPRPLLGIGLGASRPTKHWPMDRFAEIALRWVTETEGSVIGVASPSESPLGVTFMDIVAARGADKAGRSRIAVDTHLSARDLARLAANTQVFLGNDSGPRHVAAALGVPTVTIFGPEDPFEWHPYDPARHPRFFIENLTCRRDADPGMPPWCGLQICDQPEQYCMTRTEVAPVFNRCLELLKRS